MGQGQLRQPPVRRRVDVQGLVGRRAAAGPRRSWVSTTPFGSPVVPLVATTRRVARLDRVTVAEGVRSSWAAAAGSRGSTGSTASPASHARFSPRRTPDRVGLHGDEAGSRLRATPPVGSRPSRAGRCPWSGPGRPAPHAPGRGRAGAGRHGLRRGRRAAASGGGRRRRWWWPSPSRWRPTTPTTTGDGERGTDDPGRRVGPVRLVGWGSAAAGGEAGGAAGLRGRRVAGLALAAAVGSELLVVGALSLAAGWF